MKDGLERLSWRVTSPNHARCFSLDSHATGTCQSESCPYTFLPPALFPTPSSSLLVPAGSPSRGGDVTVYVCENRVKRSLPTPFYSVLVSISVPMALSTVFHSINSPDNSPFSHSVLPVLSLSYWSFQLYMSLYESFLQP